MRLRWLGVLLALGFISGWMWGQNTTITGTITDSTGTPWAGATVTASFAPSPNFTGKYTWNGQQMSTFPPVVVTADGSGVFTISVPDSALITPANSGRTFTFCPLASVVCNTSGKIPVPGPSMDITGLTSQTVVAPRMNPTFTQYGYNDAEILPAPGQGQVYYRVVDNQFRQWNGTAWVNVGGGSEGSGTVVASNQFQIGFYPTPGVNPTIQGVPSGFTSDTVGNVRFKGIDGTLHAFYNQTAPGANNGIQTALSTPNSMVVAGNDYPCVEGTFSGSPPLFQGPGNYILGFGNPAPFADATTKIEERSLCGALGYYAYNPQMGTTGNVYQLNRIVSNKLPPGGSITTFFLQSDIEYTGSGINDGFTGGGPDSEGRTFDSFDLMRSGIQSGYNVSQSAYAGGDNHIYQNQVTNNRGSWDINGEGFNWLRNQIVQNLTPMVMTAASNFVGGSTLIRGTLISNVPFVGDETYMTNTTTGGPIMQVIQDIAPGVTGTCGLAGQWKVNATLTPDNIGCVATGVTISNKRYGGTTNITVNVTGLTSALTTTTGHNTACVSDHIFTESAVVMNAGSFSGGTATGVVLAVRYSHQNNFYVTQGIHACNFMEVKANQQPGSFVGRQLFRIIGVVDSTHYLYARVVFGGWNDGFSGYAQTYNVANAGVTLTRNGSGVVTVPVSDGNLLLSNASVRVTNCANSSFNSSPFFVITSDTGTAVTWSNPGSATSTTCTKDIEVLSKLNNTQGIRDVQEFTGAQITNTNDPTTFAICSSAGASCSVEPNTNFVISSGDQLENNPYADVIQGFDRNLMTFQSQTAGSIAQLAHFDQISGFIPEATSWWRVAIADSKAGYQGLGGSKKIGLNLMDFSDTSAPFATLFFNIPTPTDVVFQFNGCVYGCTDTRSQFTYWSFPMGNGAYFQTINQANYGVTTLSENSATNQLYNKFESNQGFSYFTANGLAGVLEEENLFEWTGGSTKISTSSNAGSTNNIFFMVPTGTSFSKPITIIGTPDGCAIFTTGLLGSTTTCITSLTTNGTSGPATLSGGVLNIPVYAGGGAGPVASVFGRTGSVTATSGDYSLSLISGVPGFISVTPITVTLPTSSVGANSCTSPATATMTGVTTANSFVPTFTSDPSAVNGWGATGGLVFTSWPSSNTLNWEVCNQTANPITPGAMVLNVGVR